MDLNSLQKAKKISRITDTSLLLLSDAVYLTNYFNESKFSNIYMLKSDYIKRFKEKNSSKLLEYDELIDLLMRKDTSVINL
jgi:hypothetical protein